MKNKKLLRILVPVLILVVAGGLWLIKDRQEKQQAAKQLEVAGNPAFVLQETTFDLAAYQEHKLPVILDFGADECGPCQIMRPALEAAHEKMLGKVLIKYFDVWKKPELAQDYPVRVVPTQVFFNADGSPYMPSEKMKESGIGFGIYEHRETKEHMLTVHEGILSPEQFNLIFEDMGIRQ